MTETTNVGKVQVDLTLKSDGFKKEAKKAETELEKLKKACKEATNASNYLSAGFNQMAKRITDFITPEHVVEGAIAALAAAIVGVIKVGDEMCGVFDDLQVATGALGDSLDDLNESLENVIKNTSSDSKQLSAVMGNLNTYLGLTGESLESLTSLVSKFADITHSSADDITVNMSKAFNLWGVEEADYEKTLNRFYGISQSTGTGVSELFSAVTDGASFLRRFGYTIDEAAAELGSFEKYGISATTVITGMKMAVNNMTAEGIEPTKEAWDDLKKSIVEAKTDQDALNIAAKAFGSRYAADMVDAIKLADKGINDLTGNLDNMNHSLEDSIELQENGGMAEAWQKFSNRLALAAKTIFEKLEPAITWLLEGLVWLFDTLAPIIDIIVKLINIGLIPLKIAFNIIYVIVSRLKEEVLDPLLEWVNNFLDSIKPLTDAIGGIGSAIGGALDGAGKAIGDFFGLNKDTGEEATDSMESISDAVDDATKSMDNYCDSIDKAITKTQTLTSASAGGDAYNGMNYSLENGYRIYEDGTRVRDSGTTYNNSITVTGGGYASEEMARIYAYNQAFNAVKARY